MESMEAFMAVFIEDGEWVIGWVEEVRGAVEQERTIEGARESRSEALKDVLETNLMLASSAPGQWFRFAGLC
jgi:predicted RNase H-like HicB family nuclease